jgi:hypothetical protein
MLRVESGLLVSSRHVGRLLFSSAFTVGACSSVGYPNGRRPLQPAARSSFNSDVPSGMPLRGGAGDFASD